MSTLAEQAKAYEPKRTHNIVELDSVSVDAQVMEENDVEYPYKYIMYDGQRYRVPNSVLIQIKALLENDSSLKKVKVKSVGTGKDTQYVVIPVKN